MQHHRAVRPLTVAVWHSHTWFCTACTASLVRFLSSSSVRQVGVESKFDFTRIDLDALCIALCFLELHRFAPEGCWTRGSCETWPSWCGFDAIGTSQCSSPGHGTSRCYFGFSDLVDNCCRCLDFPTAHGVTVTQACSIVLMIFMLVLLMLSIMFMLLVIISCIYTYTFTQHVIESRV